MPSTHTPARREAGLAPLLVRLAALALIAILGCAGREASGPPISVTMRMQPDPPIVGTAAIELLLRDPTNAPVRGAVVKIEGTMTHPGMAPSFADARETAPGTYAAHLDLTMAGDWVLLVEARLVDGAVARRRLDLPGVRSRR